MKEETVKGIPETDDEAEAMLIGKNPSTANYAACGIYRIMRERDGLSVLDAYMATLNRWIAIGEKRQEA